MVRLICFVVNRMVPARVSIAGVALSAIAVLRLDVKILVWVVRLSNGIGSTPFIIMGKTKATNFLSLIALGLIIIIFYSTCTQHEVQRLVLK